jgi:hypothetical protein
MRNILWHGATVDVGSLFIHIHLAAKAKRGATHDVYTETT